MTYAEKLRDPSWQKMRLKILERDRFICQCCGDEEETLNVHHKIYHHGVNPWEYKNDELTTLCESCHREESEYTKNSLPEKMEILKKTFLSSEIGDIVISLCNGYNSCNFPQEVFIDILGFYFDNPKNNKIEFLFNNMNKDRMKEIKKTQKIRGKSEKKAI